jgi:hypothetical protein
MEMQLAGACDASCLQEFSIAGKCETVWCGRETRGLLNPHGTDTLPEARNLARHWVVKKKSPDWIVIAICSALGFAAISAAIAYIQASVR